MSLYDLRPFLQMKPQTRPRLSKSIQSSVDNPLYVANNNREENSFEKRSFPYAATKNTFESRSAINFGRSNVNTYEAPPPMRQNTTINTARSAAVSDFSYDPFKKAGGAQQENTNSQSYDPWGKPGGGAPKGITRLGGTLRTESLNQPDMNRFHYGSQLNLSSNNNSNLLSELEARQRTRRPRKEPDDFVSWINSLEAGHIKTKQQLLHTNVTREKINAESIRSYPVDAAKTYSNDLANQAEESERRKKLEKIKHAIADEEHIKHYNSWWERQGGGAPRENARRRNLTNTLISPRYAPDECEIQQ